MNIGIKYINEDIVGDIVLFLCYNCFELLCDFVGFGWLDFYWYVRIVYCKCMCDLCMRNKKVFIYEYEFFFDKELEKYMCYGDDKFGLVD